MPTPTNLYQYYTGMGQSLPSVAQNGQSYEKYGLGSASGYTGSASQNTALLGKLMGSSGATSSSGGGYSATPAATSGPTFSPSDPNISSTLSGNINSMNNSVQQEQDLAAQQAKALQEFTGQQQGVITNAYQTAMGQTGLQAKQDIANKIRDALNGSQNASAAVVPQTIAAAGGSMANNGQVTTQEGTSNIPYAEQIAQLSANLVPAENAESTAAQNTQNIAGNIVSGAQLAEQGFTLGQQNELDAIKQKVANGQALTAEEYQRESALQAAQLQASAAIQSANIGANASIEGARLGAGAVTGAAGIGAAASEQNTAATNALNKYISQLTNPGSTVGDNGIGTFNIGSAISGTPNASPTGPAKPGSADFFKAALSKYGF